MALAPVQKSSTSGALEIVNACENAIFALDRLVREKNQSPDILVACAETAAECERVMKQAHDDAERLLIERLGKRMSMKLANGDIIERYRETKEVFNDDKVHKALSDIVVQHSFSPKTGEVKLNTDFAGELVDLVLAVMGKSKPKKQALKAHRINPDTLMTKEDGAEKLRLVPAKVSQVVTKMVRGGGAK